MRWRRQQLMVRQNTACCRCQCNFQNRSQLDTSSISPASDRSLSNLVRMKNLRTCGQTYANVTLSHRSQTHKAVTILQTKPLTIFRFVSCCFCNSPFVQCPPKAFSGRGHAESSAFHLSHMWPAPQAQVFKLSKTHDEGHPG
jgi:hypothetical protein